MVVAVGCTSTTWLRVSLQPTAMNARSAPKTMDRSTGGSSEVVTAVGLRTRILTGLGRKSRARTSFLADPDTQRQVGPPRDSKTIAYDVLGFPLFLAVGVRIWNPVRVLFALTLLISGCRGVP